MHLDKSVWKCVHIPIFKKSSGFLVFQFKRERIVLILIMNDYMRSYSM